MPSLLTNLQPGPASAAITNDQVSALMADEHLARVPQTSRALAGLTKHHDELARNTEDLKCKKIRSSHINTLNWSIIGSALIITTLENTRHRGNCHFSSGLLVLTILYKKQNFWVGWIVQYSLCKEYITVNQFGFNQTSNCVVNFNGLLPLRVFTGRI